MSDTVVLMNAGQIEQVAAPLYIYAHAETLFAAKFIGTPPMATCPPSILEGVRLDGVTLGIRPEALLLSETGPIQARVGHVEYLGADAMVECHIGAHLLLCRVPGQTELTPGAPIRLTMRPDDLHLFDSDTGRRLDTYPPEFAALFGAQNQAPMGAAPT